MTGIAITLSITKNASLKKSVSLGMATNVDLRRRDREYELIAA
jgi:hypothetical protein